MADAPATVPSERAHEGEGAGIGKLGAMGGAAVEQELVVDLDRPAEGVKQEEEAGNDDKDGAKEVEFVFPETSNNLTPAILRSRLNGKKLKCVPVISAVVSGILIAALWAGETST